jgi:Domain of Unknown Function (DUF1206)
VSSLELETPGSPAQDAGPWVKWLARFGMFCSGILWILVGALAVGVALGAGGKTTDRTGALQEIGKQSWGSALLIAIAVGFAGYALWRLTAAALGRKVEANEELSVWKRLWYLARGIFYAFLCYTTVAILFGSHSGSSEKRHTEELFEWLARAAWEYDPDEAVGLDGALQKLAHQTFGPLLLGVVAGGLVVYGLFYLVKAAYREV